MWAGRRPSRATAIEWGCTNSVFLTVTANQPPSLPRIRSNPKYTSLLRSRARTVARVLLPTHASSSFRARPKFFSDARVTLHRQMNRCVLYLYKQAYMFIPSVHCDCDHEYRGTRGLERSPPPTRCFATGSTP